MPSSEHPSFKKPDNLNIKLWRYMDFTKFLSLLEDEGLFFSRVDYFDDRFEGSYPRANEEIRAAAYGNERLRKSMPFLVESWRILMKQARKETMINCGHMNECESAAMWKLYSKSNEAVCVQSTYERLHQCLDEKTYIGEVRYIDYNTEYISEWNSFDAYLHKRRSFAHERELRAITILPGEEHCLDDTEGPSVSGILKKVRV